MTAFESQLTMEIVSVLSIKFRAYMPRDKSMIVKKLESAGEDTAAGIVSAIPDHAWEQAVISTSKIFSAP